MLERHMNPSLDIIKIIAFEAEPVIDRVHYTYTLVFSVDKNNIRWKVTHQFSRFKILNLLIRKLAPKLIYSKFPKDSTTTLLGLRISKKAVDNRRLMLDIWIREVVANFEILPEEIVQSLTDFIKAPKKITTVLEKEDHVTPPVQNTSVPKRLSDSNHLFACTSSDARTNKDTVVKKKKHRVQVFVRALTRTCNKITTRAMLLLRNDWEGTTTICISRTEQLMTSSSDLTGILRKEILQHFTEYTQVLIITTVLSKAAGPFLHLSFGFYITFPAILLLASIAMYGYLLSCDYSREDEQPNVSQPSYMAVQESLRKFLNSPTLEYTDKIHPFPSFRAYNGNNSPDSKSDSSDDSYTSDDLLGMLSSDDSPFRPHDDHHSSPTHSPGGHLGGHPGGHRHGVAAMALSGVGAGGHSGVSGGHSGRHGGHSGVSGGHSSENTDRPALHESLVPGSAYDNVEFNDLIPEARAMYNDRSETHLMKVRGESYCDDNKKVNPGHAMSKLLLLELYEVEAKDGDRHDHVVSRGAAKRRLQALRTLPEKLFFIVVNYQIPGDPPVSLVSYFGLPMDLIDRFPGTATLKFLKMFERFIDIPRTEKERLEAWGVVSTDVEEEVVSPVSVPEKEVKREKKEVKKEVKESPPQSHPNNMRRASVPVSTQSTPPPSIHKVHPPLAPLLHLTAITTTGPAGVAGVATGMGNHHAAATAAAAAAAAALSPPKKSRLGALLARSTSGLGSRPTSTHISAPRAHPLSASPRHKVTALRDESPSPPSQPVMISRNRTRSSSFNDAAAVKIAAAAEKLTLIVPKNDINSVPPSANHSVNASLDASPLMSPKKVTSLMSSKSCDSGDLSTDSRLRDMENHIADSISLDTPASHTSTAHTSAVHTSVTHTHTPVIPSPRSLGPDDKSPPKSIHVNPTAASSSGWKIPSDITWPSAYDKGALPPTDFRNERFKLIPSITIGPWVVKAAVGATPALLGRKVVQRYFRGDDYMEIDIHVGSSIIASQVVGLCRGYAKNVVNDVGIVIQGEHEGELPERILAVGSLSRINVNIRQKLD